MHEYFNFQKPTRGTYDRLNSGPVWQLIIFSLLSYYLLLLPSCLFYSSLLIFLLPLCVCECVYMYNSPFMSPLSISVFLLFLLPSLYSLTSLSSWFWSSDILLFLHLSILLPPTSILHVLTLYLGHPCTCVCVNPPPFKWLISLAILIN